MSKLIIQSFENTKDYLQNAETLANSKGRKTTRTNFLGLDDKTKFHCAIASSMPSLTRPTIYFWEKRSRAILTVYSNDNKQLFVKVNTSSLAKRFGIESRTLHNYLAVHHGDATDLVAQAVSEKSDPNVMVELAEKKQLEGNFSEAAFWYEKAAQKGNVQELNNWILCLEKAEAVGSSALQAFRLCEAAAKSGDSKAIIRLGYCYEKGIGTEKSNKKAAELYAQAVKLNDPDAADALKRTGDSSEMFNLGYYYDLGQDVKRDINKAIEWYEQAARLGHAASMANLGICYERGIVVDKNLGKALEWHKKAAEQKHVLSMYCLGSIYEYGKGVPIDMNKAIRWYEQAAQLGERTAAYCLGKIYEKGDGVEKDSKKAIEYYEKAAEQGRVASMVKLAEIYENDLDGEKDLKKAVEWYEQAANKGNRRAMYMAGRYYLRGENGIEKDVRKAFAFFKQAAHLGNINAMHKLGMCYRNGIGVRKNNKKSFEWHKKSAAKEKISMRYLAADYQFGKGTKRDLAKAAEWYDKAIDLGDRVSMYRLGQMYEMGEGVVKDKIKAQELYKKAADLDYAPAKAALKKMSWFRALAIMPEYFGL